MRLAIAIALTLGLSACGKFFEEMPLGEGNESGTASGTESTAGTAASTGTEERGLDCKTAISDCPSQDVLEVCQGEPRVAQRQNCSQLCGAMTPVTCYASGDLANHGCWCEATGKVNQFGCAGISHCVARCGGPELGSSCVRGCFTRNNAVAARLYGTLVFCAQNDCKELCRNNPAQCKSCIQQTMAGKMGACAALSASCAQDRGEQPLLTP